MTHDYLRHGVTTLFAAFDVLDGTVLGRCMPRHRHQEFLRFLNTIERTDANLRDLEATAARGGPAREREAEIAARLGPLETQKTALDADTSAAETAETTARTTETNARSTFATAQAAAEGKRAVLGTIRPELSITAVTQIADIVKGAQNTNPSSTLSGACLLWFAHHPSLKTRVAANGDVILVHGEVPAIARSCAALLPRGAQAK